MSNPTQRRPADSRVLLTTVVCALLAAVSACRVVPVAAPRAAVSAVSAASSAAPTLVAAKPSSAPVVAAPDLLKPPKGGSTPLAGTLSIEASYVVASGSGGLISEAGSAVLAAGGTRLAADTAKGAASLISDHGSGVIALTGGNVISAGGGGLVSEAGGSLLSDHGAGIIANNGGGIIANNGGGIIANNGGGIVSNNGGGYRLTATASAPALPPFGQQNTVAGMLLRAVDMTTGNALPIGVNGDGKPVYAEFSNLNGGFQVYLPRGLTNNIRLVAQIPDNDDPRLHYNAIVPAGGANGNHIDEDAAAVTRILRQVIQAKFVNALQVRAIGGGSALPTDQDISGFVGGTETAAQAQAFSTLLDPVFDQIRTNPNVQTADLPTVGFLMGDVVLANAGDMASFDISQSIYDADELAKVANNPYANGKCIAAMTGILNDFRQAVVSVGKGKTPGQVASFFASKPYIKRANDYHARVFPKDPNPYYVIEKPTDLVDFISLEYFPLVTKLPYLCAAGDSCASGDELAGQDFAGGYFPPNGIAKVTNAEVEDMEEFVATDMGVPASDIIVLHTAYLSVVEQLGYQLADPGLRDELICAVHNYKQATADCVATPAE